MSLIHGGPMPFAVAAPDTMPRTEARQPVRAKPLPKGEAAARYQADRDSARQHHGDDDARGQEVDIDV